MKLNKIIIAVSLDEATQKPFHYLKEMPIPMNCEIQLVNMVPESLNTSGMEFQLQAYPLIVDRPKLEEEIKKNLSALKHDLFPNHSNVMTHVIFDTNVKAAFTDHVKNQKADLVVVATRARHGIRSFFDSSFAQHQLKFSPVNVLVLR